MTLVICEARKSILDATGHVLVTGGPGCGKTTIALVKAGNRIEAGLLAGQAVLFLSFSRAAVARIIEASKTEVPKDLRNRLEIQTLHSFFWDILRTHGYLLGAPRRLKVLLPHDERALRYGDREENAVWAAQREQLFKEAGLVSFDLFSRKVLAILRGSKVIRQIVADRFPLIIVDEAQDTAEDQWECLKELAESCQLVCLADLEQQIYEFRPGVSSERVVHISTFLNPLRVDLGSENRRSPGNDILAFGNDVMLSKPRGSPYKGVSRRLLPPKVAARNKWIRMSVGIIFEAIRKVTGSEPQNIAFLASWGRGVELISNALRGSAPGEEIRHQVLFDEGEVFLASQVMAFCLEPRRCNSTPDDLGEFLDLMLPVCRARGTGTAKKEAIQIEKWATEVRSGKIPRGAAAKKAGVVLELLGKHQFSGNPWQDWVHVRDLLRNTGVKALQILVADTDHLMSFDRRKRISAGLVDLWQRHGCYAGARKVLDSVLTEEHLLFGITDLRGINVMTIHKAKGKEFDGVIIVDEARNSPLTSHREAAPYPKSRRLFRVGITRARHHTLLLTDVATPCPLLEGHNL